MNKGFSIVEIIIAISIMVIIASSTVVAMLGSFSTTRMATDETRAAFIANEGIEATQSIRDQDWSNLIEGTHGLSSSSGYWEFLGLSDVDATGTYTREIVISSVRRDLNDEIVPVLGAIDEDSKLVLSKVSWINDRGQTINIELETYLTNWQQAVDPITANPVIESCVDYCIGVGYLGGTCRKSESDCTDNDETYEISGDQFCSDPPNDTCCCAP